MNDRPDPIGWSSWPPVGMRARAQAGEGGRTRRAGRGRARAGVGVVRAARVGCHPNPPQLPPLPEDTPLVAGSMPPNPPQLPALPGRQPTCGGFHGPQPATTASSSRKTPHLWRVPCPPTHHNCQLFPEDTPLVAGSCLWRCSSICVRHAGELVPRIAPRDRPLRVASAAYRSPSLPPTRPRPHALGVATLSLAAAPHRASRLGPGRLPRKPAVAGLSSSEPAHAR